MKICPICNAACSDDDKFCTECGTPLPDAAPQSYSGSEDAGTSSAVPATLPQNGERLKALAGSKVVLTIAIAISLIVLISMIATFAVPRALAGYVDDIVELLEEYDLGEIDLSDIDLSPLEEAGIDISDLDLDSIEVEDLIEESKGAVKQSLSHAGSITSAISSNIKEILLAVCVWLIFFSARNAMKDGVSGTGLTIILILRILALVGTAALTLLMVGGSILAIVGVSQEAEEALAPVCIIVGIIMVWLIIEIIYQVGLIKTVNRCVGENRGNLTKGKVSVFSGVIMLIKGILKCIGTVAAFVLVVVFGGIAVPAALSSAATAVLLFAGSSFIFKAKKQLA